MKGLLRICLTFSEIETNQSEVYTVNACSLLIGGLIEAG